MQYRQPRLISQRPFAIVWQSVTELDRRITFTFFSPSSRMLKKSASSALDSSKSSTGTRPPHHSAARTNLVLLIRLTVRPRVYASEPSLAAALPAERSVLARRGWAGEKSGLFEQPAGGFSRWAALQTGY
jgi:hypothetical protein